MHSFKNTCRWVILSLAILSGNSLWASGYMWTGGNSGASLLENTWTEAGYGTEQWFLGFGNFRGVVSASLNDGETFNTTGSSNGSFVLSRIANSQSTLTMNGNAALKNGTNFWVGYTQNSTAATLDTSTARLIMNDSSSLASNSQFNINGQNYSRGFLEMFGTSSISAQAIFFNMATTETYSTITMQDSVSMVTRSNGNLFFRGTEVSLTMSDQSKIATDGTGSVLLESGTFRLHLSDDATISTYDVKGVENNTFTANIQGGTIAASHDMLLQNRKSTVSLEDTTITLGLNFRLRQTDETSCFMMNGNSSVTSVGTLEIGNWDNTGGTLILNDQSKLTTNRSGSHQTTHFGTNENSFATVQLNDSSEMILNSNFAMSEGKNAVSSLELTGKSKMIIGNHGQIMMASGENASATITLKDDATLVMNSGGNVNSRQRFSNRAGSTSTIHMEGGNLVFYGGTCLGEHDRAPSDTTGSTTVNLSAGAMTTYGLIVGSRISTDFHLSGTGTLNVWNKMVMQYYDAMDNSAIVNQTGGTANIWGSSATMWNGGAGIVFGQQSNSTRKPGMWTISDGDLNTCRISLFTQYKPTSPTAADSLLVIEGGNVNIVPQTGIANSGTLAVPTTMTGGTLNVGTILATGVMYNNTFLQQGGTLSPDGGTAITPSAYANTNTGKEAYEIAELMGFEKGEGSFTTQITGNYTITSLDSAASRAGIRLEQDAAGNYDMVDITGSMNIGEDVLLSIYLSENSPEGFFPLITADGGILGEFAELQVFDDGGSLLNMDVNNLIYQGNTIVFANVPEPTTWGMLVVGIFFLAGKKWYSGRKKS